MTRELSVVHHADRRTDVLMPYAPGIVVRRGRLVFLSGVTAAPVYHSHPHREEEFDLPATMREQAVRVMENLEQTYRRGRHPDAKAAKRTAALLRALAGELEA